MTSRTGDGRTAAGKEGQLTQAQATAFADSGAWGKLTPRERAEFQITQVRCCMPAREFMRAISDTLGRTVWDSELALNREEISRELLGSRPAPTIGQILELLVQEPQGRPGRERRRRANQRQSKVTNG